jgi:hypothetical protein
MNRILSFLRNHAATAEIPRIRNNSTANNQTSETFWHDLAEALQREFDRLDPKAVVR